MRIGIRVGVYINVDIGIRVDIRADVISLSQTRSGQYSLRR